MVSFSLDFHWSTSVLVLWGGQISLQYLQSTLNLLTSENVIWLLSHRLFSGGRHPFGKILSAVNVMSRAEGPTCSFHPVIFSTLPVMSFVEPITFASCHFPPCSTDTSIPAFSSWFSMPALSDCDGSILALRYAQKSFIILTIHKVLTATQARERFLTGGLPWHWCTLLRNPQIRQTDSRRLVMTPVNQSPVWRRCLTFGFGTVGTNVSLPLLYV